jgi:hypothetical protein
MEKKVSYIFYTEVDRIKRRINEITEYFSNIDCDIHVWTDEDYEMGAERDTLLYNLYQMTGEWVCDGEFYETTTGGK